MNPRPRRRVFDKRNLWPWRDWMTVGIGVLATSPSGRSRGIKPDTAVLIADTLGSYGDVDSHDRLHKAFIFPDSQLYAVAAGAMDAAGELLAGIDKALQEIPREKRSFGMILRTLALLCYGYKRDKFTIREFPKLRLPPTEFDPLTVTPEVNAIVQERWESFSIGCDLVLASFCSDGSACLFQMNGEEQEIENAVVPGFAAIGTGSEKAIFWLSRRQQQFGGTPLRSAYHAYESKIMAEASAHVNKHLDIIVATNENHWFCSTHKLAPQHQHLEHPEINIKNLNRLWKRYRPRDTSKLGT